MWGTKVLLVSLLLFSGFNGLSQDIDSVLNKYFKAIGGRENWEAIRTLNSTTINVKYSGTYITNIDTTIMKSTFKRPDLVRVDFFTETYSSGLSWDGENFYVSRNGGVQLYPEDEGKYFSSTTAIAGQADVFLDRENIMSLEEIAINNVIYNVLIAKRPNWGLPHYYCFDKRTGLLSLSYSKESVLTFYKEYKEIGGRMFATVEEVHRYGELESKSFIKEIEINKEFGKNHFILN